MSSIIIINQKMNSHIKISNHTDNITQEIVSFYRRINTFDYNKDVIWKGARPYNY
ncbi:hypothetical protein [Confluentibacter flavum]|uniref:hypothetical protein n=1 Tax=Confluentibacter flavum TaxID=1909700 RepID=UPI0012FEDEBF|nr:hypothetical protein [Confluentibacter flavum]